jgi:hypothetical protein|tara:strand:+ start:1252 stop:1938 length:687 start_codon:yes stop_codon:yes gene_type:complete
MIIHNDTIEILKNFAEINQSLIIETGDTIKTVSEQTNVLAKAKLNQSFPQDFAIYDLNKFLGVLSLFTEPSFEFSERSITIQSSIDANNFQAGDSVAEYQFANMSLFENERKILAKNIDLPSEDAVFRLDEKFFVAIMRAAGVMSLPEIAVVANNGKLKVQANDSKTSVDSYAVDLGPSDANFKMIFKLENLKLLKGSYDVKISDKGLGHFKNVDRDLEYWIATEQTT